MNGLSLCYYGILKTICSKNQLNGPSINYINSSFII